MRVCTSWTDFPLSFSTTALTWAASTGFPVEERIALRVYSAGIKIESTWLFSGESGKGIGSKVLHCFVVMIIKLLN